MICIVSKMTSLRQQIWREGWAGRRSAFRWWKIYYKWQLVRIVGKRWKILLNFHSVVFLFRIEWGLYFENVIKIDKKTNWYSITWQTETRRETIKNKISLPTDINYNLENNEIHSLPLCFKKTELCYRCRRSFYRKQQKCFHYTYVVIDCNGMLNKYSNIPIEYICIQMQSITTIIM